MKTFEEKFTAWVDGRLTGAELAAFERELEAHPEALGEREAAHDLGNLLRSHLTPAPLPNPDFFNHQILRQIHAPASVAAPAPARRLTFWSLPWMALSGAFLLILSTALYFTMVPNTRREVRQNKQYVQNVLNAHSDDPAITATSFHSKDDNVNVLWLDGLNYLPPNHKLK
jgi:anti-sigma factor RsiW